MVHHVAQATAQRDADDADAGGSDTNCDSLQYLPIPEVVAPSCHSLRDQVTPDNTDEVRDACQMSHADTTDKH